MPKRIQPKRLLPERRTRVTVDASPEIHKQISMASSVLGVPMGEALIHGFRYWFRREGGDAVRAAVMEARP